MFLYSGNTSLLCRWLGTGTSFPERLWTLPLGETWKLSRATYSRCSILSRGVGSDDLQRSLQTSAVLWLCNMGAYCYMSNAHYTVRLHLSASSLYLQKGILIGHLAFIALLFLLRCIYSSKSTVVITRKIAFNPYFIVLAAIISLLLCIGLVKAIRIPHSIMSRWY